MSTLIGPASRIEVRGGPNRVAGRPQILLARSGSNGNQIHGAGVEVMADVEGVGAFVEIVFGKCLGVVARRDSFIGSGAGAIAFAESVLGIQSQSIIGAFRDRDLKRVVTVHSSAGLHVDFRIRRKWSDANTLWNIKFPGHKAGRPFDGNNSVGDRSKKQIPSLTADIGHRCNEPGQFLLPDKLYW